MSVPDEKGEPLDPAKFDIAAVYARYGDLMHRVAYANLYPSGRTSEVRDVVQDVVVGLLSKPPSDVRNWEAYLVRAVKNKVKDRLKSAAAQHDGGSVEDVQYESSDGTDIEADVVEELDRQACAATAWDCLAVLDQTERKVVWEIECLERPRKEVADELGVSGPRVTQIKNQGLAKLRAEMLRREAGHG